MKTNDLVGTKTKEEMRIDFWGKDDARAYDHDELCLMQEYASHQTASKDSEIAELKAKWVYEKERRKVAEKCWNACVEFIRWYNQNNKDNEEI